MKKVLCLLAILGCFLVFCSSETFSQTYDLKLMTGPMGGAWYPLGGAISDAIQKAIPGVTLSVMPGGGIGNVEALEVGKCDIGFANSCSAVDGLFGRAPFKKKMENMRQLANLYPQYFQMAVAEDSGIKSVADLKGKVLACDRKGLTGEQLSELVLKVYGLSYKDLAKVNHVSYSDGVSLMKDGHVQAFFLITTIPSSSIIDLSADRKIRMLSLPEDKIQALQKINAGFLKRVIPKGTYPGVDYEVNGVGAFTHLIISSKLPDDLVYQITKVIAVNLSRFGDVVKDIKGVTPKDLAFDVGVPYHPGALKYYKEIGAL
ncbi:MAG TPA: TAXI family TRAP transporter solute-binding subunit [Thermodesulfobacteriota bacterium]|nr:TAXI family TRAP transporter solute-binding subunit [Thermodesulfobacteriota bacterium]